ncbi:MAG: CRTAC1 family protein [Vicinamibacteria bacterium]
MSFFLLAAFALRFVNVAEEAGVARVLTFGGVAEKRYILETTGTGAAFFDYDEDSDLDLFVVDGVRLDVVPEGAGSRLYRNDGEGRFDDVTVESGLSQKGWGQGAACSDVDNDGDLDLLVTYFDAALLYRNRGDGTFIEESETSGLRQKGWHTSAAFGDYDADGFDDLFIARYVDFDRKTTPEPGGAPYCFFMGIGVMCGPKGLPPARSVLYRNRGDGTFEDRSEAAQVGILPDYSLGAVWSDLDNDQDLDLFVANDQSGHNLYLNDGSGRFRDIALEAGVAFNEDGRAQAGMGVDVSDYDNDGFFDIHVTNFSHDYNTLYQNTGGGFFLDVSFAAGIAEESYLFLGWGTGFHDFDRDGFLDIFVANGHVYPEVAKEEIESDYAQRSLLFRNRGDARFEEIGEPSGLVETLAGRGTAFADYDEDGDIDVFVTQMNGKPALYRNDPEASGHFLGLRLVGRESSRDALGARVTLVAGGGPRQIREVRSGGSYLSQSDPRAFFGLGDLERVEKIEILWPSGRAQEISAPEVDRYLLVVEGI